jgi:hypothetical protein
MTNKPMSGVPRRPIQIAIAECVSTSGDFSRTVVTLCDDGTIWIYDWDGSGRWDRMPEIPGDEP